jgi:hypothetical protein
MAHIVYSLIIESAFIAQWLKSTPKVIIPQLSQFTFGAFGAFCCDSSGNYSCFNGYVFAFK